MKRSAEAHTFINQELLDILGLPRGQVTGIRLIADIHDEPVRLEVAMEMPHEAEQAFRDRLKQYVVVEREAAQ